MRNKPFQFLNLDSRSETDIIPIYIGVSKQIFTMKSLILAQDER